MHVSESYSATREELAKQVSNFSALPRPAIHRRADLRSRINPTAVSSWLQPTSDFSRGIHSLLAVVAGKLLAAGAVYALDSLDDTVNNPEELRRRFDLANQKQEAAKGATQQATRITEIFRSPSRDARKNPE